MVVAHGRPELHGTEDLQWSPEKLPLDGVGGLWCDLYRSNAAEMSTQIGGMA